MQALEEQRQQRVGVGRECVGLNGSEIVGREFPLLAQQVSDPLSAVGLGPLETNQVRIGGRSRPIVRGDDEVFRRIVGVRQLFEGHPSGPFSLARPAVGRRRSVTVRANRNVAGRVVSDVSVHVGVHEVLRRHDEVAKRCLEVIPVPCLVQTKERHDRRVLRVERRPAERQRLEDRVAWFARHLGVVRVDGVGHEWSVPREADLERH